MSRKMLVAYSMTSTHVQTTLDYLTALKDYSGYETGYLHVTHDAHVAFDFDSAGYDVVFHNYCSRFCFDDYVSKSYTSALKRFTGLKVLAVQDEYDHTNKLKAAITDCGFQVVLTCVPQDSLQYVYPPADFPGVTFVTVFTGYVPEGFADAHGGGLPLAERPITIGYRGRDIGGRYGRLGFEKFEIGRRMKEICDTRGVSNDIAMTEESRIYGKAWFDFVGNCRSMLGSESGSNVFDFDGSIQAKHALMTKRLRRAPTYKEFEPIIADREKQISMGQISPRVFECAVMRTPMVLFRGRYSDAIVADEHYIPLELDFSNAGDVLTRLQDFPALEAMTDRTYTHLVASGNFGYRTYVKGLVKHFEARLNERRVQAAADAPEQLIARSTRQEILSESPADQPKGMDAFRVLQLRLANLGSAKGFAEQAAHLDPIFLKASQRYEKEATDLFALASRLTGKFRSELSDGKLPGESAKDFFETELLRFQNLRYDYQAERTRVVTHCEAAARPGTAPGQEPAQIAVAKLDEQWISLYCSAYSDLLKARAACISAIDMDVMTFLARAPIARANYWGNRALIQIRGSKTEVAKAVVRRMPRVHSLALSAMNAVRKHI